MIRTQVYLDDDIHKELHRLAKLEDTSMAAVARDILREGVKKRKTVDRTGVTALRALIDSARSGGDDPYLSENIDHYIYGAPKRRE